MPGNSLSLELETKILSLDLSLKNEAFWNLGLCFKSLRTSHLPMSSSFWIQKKSQRQNKDMGHFQDFFIRFPEAKFELKPMYSELKEI